MLEVELDPQFLIVLLFRQIEDSVQVAATSVDTLLSVPGHTETFVLQRLHIGLHLFCSHTVVVDAIEIGFLLASEFGADDMSLGLNLGDAVLVVDGCRPLAVGEAAGAAT